ncbi:MAG: beta-lactamase family protein [Anaerolineales bacterium]|nr:beta-lactamase family protein [Anaerolineales bacterium]
MFTSIFKKILLGVLVVALCFGIVHPAAAQTYGPDDPAEFESFLDAFLAEQMDTYHIPGVVFTFVKDGEVFFSKGYGYADLEKQTPFDPAQTLLTVASLGKAFTAVGLLQMNERGIIDLHEDIRPYFTEFPLDTRFDEPLTFANLLTHTDGFEARMIGLAAQTEDQLLPLGELIQTYTPTQLYPPGKYMTYGDFAANLAGYLTQQISGAPFEQVMADNLLIPLGMTSSTFNQHLTPEMFSRLAPGYEYQDGQHAIPFFYIRYAPAGGLRTTAADMNHFMLALLNGGEYAGTRILDEATVDSIFAQQFAPDPRMAGITYGLFEHFGNGQRVLLRDGDGVGTRSRMVLFPDQEMGFFISYNSGDSNLRMDVLDAILEHYFPVTGNKGPAPMQGYEDRARQFAGSYRPLQADMTTFGKSMFFFSQLIEVTATDEGYLSITTTGMGDEHSSVMGGFEGTSLWVEVEPLYFERVDGKGHLAFVQDEAGNIVQMISGQGYHSTFTRLTWYESQSFQIVLVELAAVLLISMLVATFVNWPVGALIRKLRKQPAEPTSWLAIFARVWAAVVGGMLGLFVFRAIGVLYAIDTVAGFPNFVWGVSTEIVSALNSIYLPALLALPLPVFVGLAWGNRWWKVSARVHYTLVTLSVLAVIWWAQYWNLLGFRM